MEPSVSDDGEISGYFTNRFHSIPYRPARWSLAEGFQILSDESYQAYGISGDGQVIVGTGSNEARVWREGNGWSVLPSQGNFHPKDANAANHDGSVIVGFGRVGSTYEAFRWTATAGICRLGILPGNEGSGAYASTPDGRVVVGDSRTSDGWEAFRWTEAEGMVRLGDIPGGEVHSDANDVSDDGNTIVGTTGVNWDSQAFIWTADGVVRSLGKGSVATAVSADGSVVVGQLVGPDGGAMIWTEATGVKKISTLLATAGLPVPPQGLSGATDVSSDGRHIACYTVLGAYLVTLERSDLPEPTLASPLLLGAALLARARRRAQ
jgi:uncharacterized membrane protein